MSDCRTLLLVEDELLIALNEARQLEAIGYKVITAGSGEKAVAISDSDASIDLILMDIDLGAGIDGTAAAETILRRHQLPLLFLTSHMEKAIVEKTERITNYGYVTKNAGYTVLDASIKMALKLFIANSQLREKEAEMAVINGKLTATLESIGDGFFSIDDEWRFDYINARGEEILGVKRADILGKRHWEVFPLTLGTKLESEYRRAANGEIRIFEYYYEPWDRWFHNRCFPREGGGMSVYFEDITEKKGLQDEMLLTLASLEQAQQVAHLGSWRWYIKSNRLEWAEMQRRKLQVDRNIDLLPPE